MELYKKKPLTISLFIPSAGNGYQLELVQEDISNGILSTGALTGKGIRQKTSIPPALHYRSLGAFCPTWAWVTIRRRRCAAIAARFVNRSQQLAYRRVLYLLDGDDLHPILIRPRRDFNTDSLLKRGIEAFPLVDDLVLWATETANRRNDTRPLTL